MSSWSRIVLIAGCAAALSAQDSATTQAYVQKARGLYLNLRTEGLDTFKASVVPDWEYILKSEGGHETVPPEALAKLRGLHFALALDGKGALSVTHRAESAADNEQVERGFQQIFSGMEQMLHGFFDTWKVFMLSSPFPAAGVPVRMTPVERDTQLAFKDGDADVLLTLGPDLRLRVMEIRTAQFTGIIHPDFIRSDRGLALAGYHATYNTPSGKDQTRLEVRISYTQLKGLMVPSDLHITGAYEASPFHARIAFKDAEVGRVPVTQP